VRALAVEQVVTGQAHAKDVADALGVATSTITRWVKEAQRQPPPPMSAADMVARFAPPPAAPEAPPAPLDTSVEGMIARLSELAARHDEAARRAKAIGDAATEQKALASAGAAMAEIRKLRTSIEGASGVVAALTAHDLAAARQSIRARIAEIEAAGPPTCPHCGAELRVAWAASDEPPIAPGGVTRGASHVTRDGGDDGRGAS
jgi:transposase-like protein